MEDTLDSGKQTITVPFEEYQDLVRRIGNLERGTTPRPRRVTDRTAQLREWEGKLVIGAVGSPFVVNAGMPDEDMHYKLVVVDKEGNQSEVDVPYLKFLNEAPPVQVKILSQKATEIIQTQGITNKRDPASDKLTSSHIELEVRSMRYVSTVLVEAGEFKDMQFDIDNRFLNM